MLEIIENIGYSSKAIIMGEGLPAATLQDGSKQAITGQTFKDSETPAPWAFWGTDNKLPITMAEHIENCGVLSAALDAKARISVGKGVQPFVVENVGIDGKEELSWFNDPEINEWLEENDLYEKMLDFSFDKNAYGWRVGTYMLSPDRKRISRLYRKDVYECRLEKKNKSGFIENMYMCADWGSYSQSYDTANHIKLPVLKDGFELVDLQSRAATSSGGYEFGFIDRRKRNGRQYYTMPLWYAVQEWVKLARSVPLHKTTQFNRQITLQYVITISQKYWDSMYQNWGTMEPKKKQEIFDAKCTEIDNWLSGSGNAYKSLITSSFIDAHTGKEIDGITIKAIDDKMGDGKLLPDSAAANSEILFSVMMNPALMGAGQPGGPYSNNAGGSNMRESYIIMLMILEEERKMNQQNLNLIKRFNGWDKKTGGKPLVFRFPSGLLTTLDTGKSTKSENL